VLPNQINSIQISTKTYDYAQKRVVVNAIDSLSGDLVHSWLLILASQVPTPTAKH